MTKIPPNTITALKVTHTLVDSRQDYIFEPYYKKTRRHKIGAYTLLVSGGVDNVIIHNPYDHEITVNSGQTVGYLASIDPDLRGDIVAPEFSFTLVVKSKG